MPVAIFDAIKRHEKVSKKGEVDKVDKNMVIGIEPTYRIRPPDDYRHSIYPDTMEVETLALRQMN